MRRAAIVTTVILVAAGCSGDSLPTEGPVGVYRAVGEGGNMAAFDGVLAMQDGCLTVEAAEEGRPERVIPLFPDEAEWKNGQLEFAGEQYAPGAAVGLGGSIGDLSDAYVPSACDPDLPTWIVHQDTESLIG